MLESGVFSTISFNTFPSRATLVIEILSGPRVAQICCCNPVILGKLDWAGRCLFPFSVAKSFSECVGNLIPSYGQRHLSTALKNKKIADLPSSNAQLH